MRDDREHRARDEATARQDAVARTATLKRDAARTLGQNLEEGAALALAAASLAAAFERQ